MRAETHDGIYKIQSTRPLSHHHLSLTDATQTKKWFIDSLLRWPGFSSSREKSKVGTESGVQNLRGCQKNSVTCWWNFLKIKTNEKNLWWKKMSTISIKIGSSHPGVGGCTTTPPTPWINSADYLFEYWSVSPHISLNGSLGLPVGRGPCTKLTWHPLS